MFHQTSGSRLLSAIALVSLFSACAQQSSSAAAPGGNGPPILSPPSGTTSTPQVATSPSAPLVRGLPDFSGLVTAVGPAVVNVQVVERMNSNVRSNGVSPFGNGNDDDDDALGEFFRRFGIPRGQGQIPNQRGEGSISRGEGSGFIVSPDGYLLTNAHVVDNASSVTVRLTDHREYKAKVVGVDDTSDVAVLKIDGKNLPVVKIGDPTRLRAGEWVVAIGSPFGMENSVTAGIVSAKPRYLPGGGGLPMIQTDVAINPGSSGSPLFNLRGKLVGINSMMMSSSGGYDGVSLALPIDVAMQVAGELRDHGYMRRSRLGAQVQEVTPELARSFGLAQEGGAVVLSVSRGGPADRAGLRTGDIILGLRGTGAAAIPPCNRPWPRRLIGKPWRSKSGDAAPSFRSRCSRRRSSATPWPRLHLPPRVRASRDSGWSSRIWSRRSARHCVCKAAASRCARSGAHRAKRDCRSAM